jgi:hypothetical protein
MRCKNVGQPIGAPLVFRLWRGHMATNGRIYPQRKAAVNKQCLWPPIACSHQGQRLLDQEQTVERFLGKSTNLYHLVIVGKLLVIGNMELDLLYLTEIIILVYIAVTQTDPILQ